MWQRKIRESATAENKQLILCRLLIKWMMMSLLMPIGRMFE
jgi:hypothetical protein